MNSSETSKKSNDDFQTIVRLHKHPITTVLLTYALKINEIESIILGHTRVLHACCSVETPTHPLPLHDLSRERKPVLHVWEHPLQARQLPQFPEHFYFKLIFLQSFLGQFTKFVVYCTAYLVCLFYRQNY